jgi:hypothetical protein
MTRKPPGAKYLQWLRAERPKQYAARVRGAMRGAKGRIPLGAKLLGVSQPTLYLWLKRDAKLLGPIARAPRGKPRTHGSVHRRAKTARDARPTALRERGAAHG